MSLREIIQHPIDVARQGWILFELPPLTHPDHASLDTKRREVGAELLLDNTFMDSAGVVLARRRMTREQFCEFSRPVSR